jgi:hypothetical protein
VTIGFRNFEFAPTFFGTIALFAGTHFAAVHGLRLAREEVAGVDELAAEVAVVVGGARRDAVLAAGPAAVARRWCR